ncbi:MAG: RsmB/NOP family class I SAM-dependent RNA methyltransferase [Candidatus Marsarchaeota archaeon]|nr:RsmB/NOP family class I SAM-dependent RNA methyltransferase [Candidatus Marsarchaeota archaeon]
MDERTTRILVEKYGYNEFFAFQLSSSLGAEALELAEAEGSTPVKAIRVNTLKTGDAELVQSLEDKGFTLKKCGWTKHGYWVVGEPRKPTIGSTLEYMCGHYFIQSPASIFTVETLNPEGDEKVLDMAAGVGGKTTYICQLMSNTGVVLATEPSRQRVGSLRSNLSRMGCENSVVLQTDGRNVAEMGCSFDRILLDAPCTATGLVALYPQVKARVTPRDVVEQSALQYELLKVATAVLNRGGTLVYSTCSLLQEEGEQVVKRALTDEMEIIPVDPPFKKGESSGSSILPGSVRLYRHTHRTEGFFICKIRKRV